MAEAHPAPTGPKLEAEIDRKPVYTDHPALDRIIEVTLELGAEIWVNRARLNVIETLLEQKGSITRADIEMYQPTREEQKAQAQAADAFAKRLYRAYAEIGADGGGGPLDQSQNIYQKQERKEAG